MTKRIDWIDVLKGIGITLVVLGHLTNYDEWIMVLIYSFHMPLFFVLSGYLYNASGGFKEFIYRKYKSILLPFLICQIVNSILVIIRSFLKHEEIGIEVLRNLFFLDGITAINPAIWFLIVLFIIEIIYFFIFNKKLIYKVVICSVLFILSTWISKKYYFGIEYIPISMIFLIIGDISKNIKLKTILKKLMSFWWIILPLWIVLSLYNGQVDIYRILHGKSYLLMILDAVLGIAFFAFLSMQLKNSKILKYYGRNSIIVLCSHQYFVLYIFRRGLSLLSTMGISGNLMLFVQCVMCACIMLIMRAVIEITNNIVSRLQNSNRGGVISHHLVYSTV